MLEQLLIEHLLRDEFKRLPIVNISSNILSRIEGINVVNTNDTPVDVIERAI
jgi:hypothetical protein